MKVNRIIPLSGIAGLSGHKPEQHILSMKHHNRLTPSLPFCWSLITLLITPYQFQASCHPVPFTFHWAQLVSTEPLLGVAAQCWLTLAAGATIFYAELGTLGYSVTKWFIATGNCGSQQTSISSGIDIAGDKSTGIINSRAILPPSRTDIFPVRSVARIQLLIHVRRTILTWFSIFNGRLESHSNLTCYSQPFHTHWLFILNHLAHTTCIAELLFFQSVVDRVAGHGISEANHKSYDIARSLL